MRTLPDKFFGSIALKNKLLSREQLAEALREQDARSRAGRAASLGEVCRELGLLSAEGVNAVLWAQAKSEVLLEDTLLGRIAVKKKLLTDAGLAAALEQQARRGPFARLGAILVENGTLSAADLAVLLKTQRESRRLRPVIVPPLKPRVEPPAAKPAPAKRKPAKKARQK